jgi:hypothetical protein
MRKAAILFLLLLSVGCSHQDAEKTIKLVSDPWPGLTAAESQIIDEAKENRITVRASPLSDQQKEPALATVNFITSIIRADGLDPDYEESLKSRTTSVLGASLIQQKKYFQDSDEYLWGSISINLTRVSVAGNLAFVSTCENRRNYALYSRRSKVSDKADPKSVRLWNRVPYESFEFGLIREGGKWIIVSYARTGSPKSCPSTQSTGK